jgi:hypothetical protein
MTDGKKKMGKKKASWRTKLKGILVKNKKRFGIKYREKRDTVETKKTDAGRKADAETDSLIKIGTY